MAELTGALKATGAALAFDAIGGGRLASQILTGMEAAASAAAVGYSRYGSAVSAPGPEGILVYDVVYEAHEYLSC